MITLREGDFLDVVAVDIPEVAFYRGEGHLLNQAHVLAHLVVILWLRGTELEVDDNPLMAVGHHTVRTMLTDCIAFKGENVTFVIKCPTT